MARKFAVRDDVVFIAVTADLPHNVRKLLADVLFEYEKSTGAVELRRQFRFSGYPKSIIVGKTGEIVYRRSTIRVWEKIESAIEKELRLWCMPVTFRTQTHLFFAGI